MGTQLLDSISKFLNRDESSGQVLLFNLLQLLYLIGKELDPTSASSEKYSLAPRSRGDPNGSTIAMVLRFDDELLLLQGVYDSGHRWRPHLFGLSEFAQRDWAIENNHGKG
jgi:hypothetical protein